MLVFEKFDSLCSAERFATPTLLCDVWIPEDELGAQFILQPIHLAPNDAEQGLAINEDLDAVLLNDLVEFTWLVHVFEMICQPRTTSVLDAHSD